MCNLKMDDNQNNSPKKSVEFNYMSVEQDKQIKEGFELLRLQSFPSYVNPYQFSRDLQKASNLQFEGIKFFTSGSTASKDE
jgi:hypothetical protein